MKFKTYTNRKEALVSIQRISWTYQTRSNVVFIRLLIKEIYFLKDTKPSTLTRFLSFMYFYPTPHSSLYERLPYTRSNNKSLKVINKEPDPIDLHLRIEISILDDGANQYCSESEKAC